MDELNMEREEQTIDYHLHKALSHLEIALNISVNKVLENESTKKQVGQKWEGFLGEFFSIMREKGKKSKINLLSWLTFPRIR
ncbi:MAG: hypothetical protein JWM44_3374 [Bacilli bacterium]|nr:hypothetical protein [Bacilli bacterium]